MFHKIPLPNIFIGCNEAWYQAMRNRAENECPSIVWQPSSHHIAPNSAVHSTVRGLFRTLIASKLGSLLTMKWSSNQQILDYKVMKMEKHWAQMRQRGKYCIYPTVHWHPVLLRPHKIWPFQRNPAFLIYCVTGLVQTLISCHRW